MEGHCLSVCLFDCRSVDLRLGRGHDLVRKLALQVYKNICNNISKLRNLLHSTQKVGRHFISYCVPANTVIHRTDAVHV